MAERADNQTPSRAGSLFSFRCWACGKRCVADAGMQKWLKKNAHDPGARPLGPCCAYGGYFGGS